jgi:hypothetical protein
MSKDRYRIAVSYDCNKYEWGSLDKPAEVIAKVEVAGGGTGSGCRDLSFYYPTLRKAENAVERFRKDGRFDIESAPTSLDEW